MKRLTLTKQVEQAFRHVTKHFWVFGTLVMFITMSNTAWSQTAGATCGNPMVISSLPFNHSSNVGDYGDNYGSADIPALAPGAIASGSSHTYYLNGPEAVYAFTSNGNGTIDVDATFVNNSWHGIFVFKGCPFSATLGYHTAIGGTSRSIPGLPVEMGETYYIVISNWSEGAQAYTLDVTGNITIPVDCNNVTAGAISGDSSTCAAVSFDLEGTNILETGITYEWEASTDGGATWNVIAGANTYRLTTSITEATDFRYTITCTVSSNSDTSAPFTVALKSASECYCTPTGAVNNSDEIRNFTLGDLDNDSAGNEGTAGYSDYTQSVAPAQLEALTGYVASLTSGGGSGNHGAAIWIDYNDNGTFETSEMVAWLPSSIGANATVNFPEFTVENYQGLHRLRVQYHYLKSGEELNPCTLTTTYGETEDYMVNILPPPSCARPMDLAVDNITHQGAEISWTAMSGESEWNVRYGETATFDLDDSNTYTQIPVSSLAEYEITGLLANTQYSVAVQADCGSENSEWSLVVTFRTECGPVYDWSEDFDSYGTGNILPECWERVVNGSGSMSLTTTSPASGTRNLYMYSSSAANSVMAVLPEFSNVNAGTHWLKFKVRSGTANGVLKLGYVDGGLGISDFVELEDINIPNTTYTDSEQAFTIPSSVPATARLAILNPGNNSYSYYMDDFVWEASPSCITPKNFALDSVSADSATVSWSAQSGESAWNVRYGLASTFDLDDSGTYTEVQVSGNEEHVFTGLTDNTGYAYAVQADCGAVDGTSAWSDVQTFRTTCFPGQVPFFEGFENGYTHGADLGNCWSQEDISGTTKWVVNNTETLYNRSPRTGSWNVTLRYGNTDWMFYPVELTGGVAYELVFYARQDGAIASNAKVSAGFGTANNAAAMTTFIPETGLVNGDYQKIDGFFTPSTSGVYFIGIKGEINTSPWYISIDDISVDLAPSCIVPTNLALDAVSADSATISWDAQSSETAWNVRYGLASTFDMDDSGTYTQGAANGNETHSLTGLTQNTEYAIAVQADCGVDGTSDWSAVYTFRTNCGAASVPYLLDFNDAITPNLPSCTSQENLGSGNNWTTVATSSYGMSGNALRYLYNSLNAANVWFYTQGINLEAGVDYQISYKYAASASYPESLKVAYGTSPSATGMSTVLLDSPNLVGTGNELIAFSVPTDGVYYFGFHAYSIANQNFLYIDDVLVEVAPTCMTPTDFVLEDVSSDSFTISWTANSGESAWNVRYGEADTFDMDDSGTYTEVPANGVAEHTFSGLDSNTEYAFAVQADCGVDGTSAWSAVYSITTDCGAQGVPYFVDFDTLDCLTIQNAGSGNNWSVVSGNINGFSGTFAIYQYHSTQAGNAWLYMAPVALEAGVDYQISYKYGSRGWDESMKVAYGTDNDYTAMTTILADHPLIDESPLYNTVAFTVPADGVYYFGFNAYSAPDQFGLLLDDILIEEVPSLPDYVYDNGWTPGNPTGVATDTDNILVLNGSATGVDAIGGTDANNVTIESGASLDVNGVLNVYGDLTIDGDLVFTSTANGDGELGTVGGDIYGEATVHRYFSNNRAFRMVSSAVTTSTSINANWQEGVNNPDMNTNLDPNPGYGTHITGSQTGANGFDATELGTPSMYSADIANQVFEIVANTDNTTLEAGDAYLLYVRGNRGIDLNDNSAASSTILRTKGELLTGNHTQNFTAPAIGSSLMIGNPYQSSVNIYEVLKDSQADVHPFYYFGYDPTIGDHGAYVTVVFHPVTGEPSNSSSSQFNQYLQPGQAIQVLTSKAGSVAVEFTEAHKTPGNHTQTNFTDTSLNGDNVLTIQLYTTENFTNGGPVHDSFGMLFDSSYDNEVTLMDAKKPMNFYENLGIDHNGTYLSVEFREMPIAGEVYPLYSAGYTHSNYTLNMTLNGLEDSELYLDDHFTGISTLLINGEVNYNFVVTNDPMSAASDRFSIRVEQRPLGVNDNLFYGISLFPNPLTNDTFYINAPQLDGKQVNVSISDMSGRQVYTSDLDCVANKISVTSEQNLASGVYLVTLRHSGQEFTLRLVKE